MLSAPFAVVNTYGERGSSNYLRGGNPSFHMHAVESC